MPAAAREELYPASVRRLTVEGFFAPSGSGSCAFGAGHAAEEGDDSGQAMARKGLVDEESGATPRNEGGGGHGRQLHSGAGGFAAASNDDEDFDDVASSHHGDEGGEHLRTIVSEWTPPFASRPRFAAMRHMIQMSLIGGFVSFFVIGVSLLLVGFFQGSSMPRLRTSGSLDTNMGRIESWQVRPLEAVTSDGVATLQGGGDRNIVDRNGVEQRSSRMAKTADQSEGVVGKSLADAWGEVGAMSGFYNPLAAADRQMPKERHDKDGEDFDCMDTESWMHGWTQKKKNFCCTKHGVGCKGPPPPPSDNVGERTYNCHAGRMHWKYEWDPDQQAFCCRTTGFPCEGRNIHISDIAHHPNSVGEKGTNGLEHGQHHTAIHSSEGGHNDGGGRGAGDATKSNRRCEPGEDKCPASWKTGSSGGFYCRDNHGCRSRDMGPWDPITCADSCAVGIVGAWADEIAGVPVPATTTSAVPGTTLYCWSLCSQAYEKEIMRKQVELGAGIFSCDQAAIVTFDEETFAVGSKSVMSLVTQWEPVGRSKDGTAGNTLQFMKAWETIKGDGRWMSASWMVKADPDAVIFADRIRGHMKPFEGQKVYVRNCDKPMGEGPMMFGAVEVISAKAMAVYYGSGGRCEHEVPWQSWGEDLFMMRCLEHLGVGPAADFNLVHDGVCKGVSCNDGLAAAFHPMKSVGAWMKCYAEASTTR